MVNIDEFKTPPQNLEAEKWVISWIFLDNEIMWVYEWDRLAPEDFYQKSHQFIYAAIKKLRTDRKTIDVVTVWNQLTKDGNMDFIWWLDYLYELSTFLLTTSWCSEYSKIVKDQSILRNMKLNVEIQNLDLKKLQEIFQMLVKMLVKILMLMVS